MAQPADKLTMELVNAVVDQLVDKGRCDYRLVLKKMGWGVHRYDQMDWSEVKELAEIQLGVAKNMGRMETIAVKSIFLEWQDAGPRKRASIENDNGGGPRENPRAYCAVNKKPGGLALVKLASEAMLNYLEDHKANHVKGRIDSLTRLNDTATVEHVAGNGMDRNTLAQRVIDMIPPVPQAVQNALEEEEGGLATLMNNPFE